MNARQRLSEAAEWLGWNDENLSSGLRTAFDALRLYDYAQAHPELPEMADDWDPELISQVLGYDPLAANAQQHEAPTSGVDVVVRAMQEARMLIDSVAWVQREGDKEPVLSLLDAALGA